MKFHKPSFTVATLAAVALMAGSTFARADDAQIAAGHQVWSDAGCEACHGASGQGGTDPDQPVGPSLRSSKLTPEEMIETVSCGRPGTPMAAWEQGAYTEHPCYGKPLGPVPSNIIMIGTFSPDEIKALVAYIKATFAGAP